VAAVPAPARAARAVAGGGDAVPRDFVGDLGLAPRTLADKLAGASYAELEQVALDIRRRLVLALPDGNLVEIARTRMEQWRKQAHP
jgi:hypothetical protein